MNIYVRHSDSLLSPQSTDNRDRDDAIIRRWLPDHRRATPRPTERTIPVSATVRQWRVGAWAHINPSPDPQPPTLRTNRGPRTVKALTTEPHQSSLNQAQASDLTGPRALSCRTCDDAIGTPESRPTRHLRPRPCPAAAPATVHRQGCAAIGCLAHPHRRGRNAKLRQNERKSRISSNGRRPPEASAHD